MIVEITLGKVCALIARFADFAAVHGTIEREQALIRFTGERAALTRCGGPVRFRADADILLGALVRSPD